MIQVAIQGARFAPYAVKALPYIKIAAIGAAIGVTLNEAQRAGTKAHNRRAEKAFRKAKNEENEAHRTEQAEKNAFWRRATGMRVGETYSESVKRRARTMWDIVCFAGGDTLYLINFFTTKVVKAALGIAGAVVFIPTFLVSALGIYTWKAIRGKKEEAAKTIDKVDQWLTKVLLAPFRAVRWLDRKISSVAYNLTNRRAADMMDRQDWDAESETLKTTKATGERTRWGWAKRTTVKTQSAKDATPAEPEVKEPEEEKINLQEADLNLLIVLLTQQEETAKKDPKAYGARLFTKHHTEEKDATEYRKAELKLDLEALHLADKDVTLAIQGYDEAMQAASSNTATS